MYCIPCLWPAIAAAAIGAFVATLPVAAQAALQSRAGGTMVYDTDLDITWLADANHAGRRMTWQQARDWAAQLSYGGYSDWRLPSARDVRTGNLCSGSVDSDCISEMGHLFKTELHGFVGATLSDLGLASGQGGLFQNFPADGYYYWLQESNPRCCSPPNDNAYLFAFQSEPGYALSGEQGLIYIGQNNNKYAWAVRTGDVASSPGVDTGDLESANFTDLWWVTSESGWGVSILHERDTIFLVLYVYDEAERPKWYAASNLVYHGIVSGAASFTGDLYETTGHWFGASSFNPSHVTVSAAGRVKLDFGSPTQGQLFYSAAGVGVNKTISRQTLRIPEIAGNYVGHWVHERTGCRPGYGPNGPATDEGAMVVTLGYNPTRGRQELVLATGTCTFQGEYIQEGRLGRSSGTAQCSGGDSSAGSLSQIEQTSVGVTMRVAFGPGSRSGCSDAGVMGGVRYSP